jgi:hypothetical protein
MKELMQTVAHDGYALFESEAEWAREAANGAAWELAERILGQPARMVEFQPIRPVAHGRSFASTSAPTPLHTDSQRFSGAPPDAQIMICERAPKEGGEVLLVDGFALLDALLVADPALYAALFDEPRTIPFVFGDVEAPTVAFRGGALAWTCSPMPPRDPVGRRLAPHLDAAPRMVVAPRAGDVLVVDNRRMLHGRHAFSDSSRCYARLLAWLDDPLSRSTHEPRARRPPASPHPPVSPDADRRLRLVLAMIRGVPPGVLAARESLPEPLLYEWRDQALAGAGSALGVTPRPSS